MSVEFVDTNILLYAHEPASGAKQSAAIHLVKRLHAARAGAISLQVLQEFYSAATRKLHMPSQDAEAVIVDLATWTIYSPVHADVLGAIQIHRRHRISWWDALIVNSAIQLGCSVLWSEDLSSHHKYGSLTVRNPFA